MSIDQTTRLKRTKILLVEDNKFDAQVIRYTLDENAFDINHVKDAESALDAFLFDPPEIILADLKLPKMSGVEMIERVRSSAPDLPIIVITATQDFNAVTDIVDLGIDGFLSKPINQERLNKLIRKVLLYTVQRSEIDEKNNFISYLLNTTPNFVLVMKQDEIEFINNTFLEYLGFDANSSQYEESTERNFELDLNPLMLPLKDEFKSGEWQSYIIDNAEQEPVINLRCPVTQQVKAFKVQFTQLPSSGSLIFSFTDISELHEQNVLLEKTVNKDPLTGIYNRRAFDTFFADEINAARKLANPLTLIMADIDYFKRINDTYGHDIGDIVLQKFADVLDLESGKQDKVCRWGGEEFILIQPAKSVAQARLLTETIKTKLETFSSPDIPKVTCSFGVTSLQVDDSKETFLKRLDQALYLAKKRGRNRTVVL